MYECLQGRNIYQHVFEGLVAKGGKKSKASEEHHFSEKSSSCTFMLQAHKYKILIRSLETGLGKPPVVLINK